MNSLK
ncbi:hypothetical protein POWCR01_000019200 [Plasmodium ovale]